MKNYQQTPKQRRVAIKAAKQAFKAAKRGGVGTPSLEERLAFYQPLPRWPKFYGFGVYW